MNGQTVVHHCCFFCLRKYSNIISILFFFWMTWMDERSPAFHTKNYLNYFLTYIHRRWRRRTCVEWVRERDENKIGGNNGSIEIINQCIMWTCELFMSKKKKRWWWWCEGKVSWEILRSLKLNDNYKFDTAKEFWSTTDQNLNNE